MDGPVERVSEQYDRIQSETSAILERWDKAQRFWEECSDPLADALVSNDLREFPANPQRIRT